MSANATGERERPNQMDWNDLSGAIFASLIANGLTALASWLFRKFLEWLRNRKRREE